MGFLFIFGYGVLRCFVAQFELIDEAAASLKRNGLLSIEMFDRVDVIDALYSSTETLRLQLLLFLMRSK